LTILDTPVAGVPVKINSTLQSTDENGEIAVSLKNGDFYSVNSGIEAVAFAEIYEKQEALSTAHPVVLRATRLLSSLDAPCRIIMNDLTYFYFTVRNVTDRVLEVPSHYGAMNSIQGPGGVITPPSLFAPGTTGFTVLEDYFRQGDSISGAWDFLGQRIVVDSTQEYCRDRSVPEGCQPVDPALLRAPLAYTKRVILRLTKMSNDAARRGVWRGSNGKFTVPFLRRGANALAKMEFAFKDSKTQIYSCENTPMSCVARRVPKSILLKAFGAIFEGKVPRGLERVKARANKEKQGFQRVLKVLPTRYTVCN
jgi:hypothetical protein